MLIQTGLEITVQMEKMPAVAGTAIMPSMSDS
jgi:hypothetical protein